MGIKRLVTEATPKLIVEGAREHNLKAITVEFPLQHLVCVTGVSGSGKSTLMQDVLVPALLRHFGKATETPGAHERLLGADFLSDAVFVDQSPIGKTARSNPASYVGAFDEIRKLFAREPLALQRGYNAGMFSFNAGDGRCPTCGGSGFEHVEMQFLSDVYLRCPDCDGRRFRKVILDVKIDRRLPGDLLRELSVADVLELTVNEAVQLFRDDREVLRVLQPIVDVGLEYVKLGQPVPTLSGGEAQRLKLAGFLAEAVGSPSQRLARRGTLYLFDEPTTGLHFDDIAKLMRAFRKLLDAGHSIIVIEHNLDVIRASDWLIDLGPEGGEAGGALVCTGTPEDVKRHPTSHTGRALADYDRTLGVGGVVEEGAPLQSLLKRARDERRCPSLNRMSNASVLLPEPDTPVITLNLPRGMSTSIDFRLCSRALTMRITSSRTRRSSRARLSRLCSGAPSSTTPSTPSARS
jgi:excinuclease ABC subunit A